MDWIERSTNEGESAQEASIHEILNLQRESPRKPIFLYVSSAEEDFANDTKNIEGTCFKDERVMLGSRFFHLVRMPWTEVNEDLEKIVGRRGEPTFVAFDRDGKRTGVIRGRYSPSKLFSLMTKTANREYRPSIKLVLSEVQKVLTELDKLDAARKELDLAETKNPSERQKLEIMASRKLIDDQIAKLTTKEQEVWKKVTLRDAE